MKLKRLITESELNKLKELTTNSSLVLEDCSHTNCYYGVKLIEQNKKDIEYIDNLLKEVIEDFVSFSNFTLKYGMRIRFQYIWDKSLYFKGVGYISLEELNKGFKND